MNLYAFAGNDGVNKGDSLGLTVIDQPPSTLGVLKKTIRDIYDIMIYGDDCERYKDGYLRNKKWAEHYRSKFLQAESQIPGIFDLPRFPHETEAQFQGWASRRLAELSIESAIYEDYWRREQGRALSYKGEYDKCRCVKDGFYCATITGIIGAGADIAGIAGWKPALAVGLFNGFVTAVVCGEASHIDVATSSAYGIISDRFDKEANIVIAKKAKELLISRAKTATLPSLAIKLKAASVAFALGSIHVNLKPIAINIRTKMGKIFFAGKDKPEDTDVIY